MECTICFEIRGSIGYDLTFRGHVCSECLSDSPDLAIIQSGQTSDQVRAELKQAITQTKHNFVMTKQLLTNQEISWYSGFDPKQQLKAETKNYELTLDLLITLDSLVDHCMIDSCQIKTYDYKTFGKLVITMGSGI